MDQVFKITYSEPIAAETKPITDYLASFQSVRAAKMFATTHDMAQKYNMISIGVNASAISYRSRNNDGDWNKWEDVTNA